MERSPLDCPYLFPETGQSAELYAHICRVRIVNAMPDKKKGIFLRLKY